MKAHIHKDSIAARNRHKRAKRQKTIARARLRNDPCPVPMRSKRRANNQLAKKLIRRFQDKMAYDCHGMNAKYERSHTKDQIIEMGDLALPAIIKFLKRCFKGRHTGTMTSGDAYWEEFGVWVWITFSIIRRCRLEPPYPTQPFLEMDMGVIIAACEDAVAAAKSEGFRLLTMEELEWARRRGI